MPGSGTLTLTGIIVGFPAGQRTVSIPWVLGAAIDSSNPISLGVGITTISVPSGASMMLVEPPSGNTIPILLLGSLTDTGITLHKTFPHWQSLDSSVTNVYFRVGTIVNGVQITFY